MEKNTAKRLMVILSLVIGLAISFSILALRIAPSLGIVYNIDRNYPNRVLDNTATYRINPDTILVDINQRETNVFSPISDEPVSTTSSWPGINIFWDQEKYLVVANALHEFVWKETLDQWLLYSAQFRIFKCQDTFDGFNQARFIYYKHDNYSYVVHELWITPSDGEAGVGNANYDYTGNWKNIDLNNAQVGKARDALFLAEENGGSEIRLANANECDISVRLSPYAFEYSFPPRPFNRRDWGWQTSYSAGSLTIFDMVINPQTGQYKIQH